MKTVQRIAVILSFSLVLGSCIKDEYPTKGVLVSYDARLCACCGGIFVNLNNVDTLNANTMSVSSLPADFVFNGSEFPLKVQFAYQDGDGCPSNEIVITKIKRR